MNQNIAKNYSRPTIKNARERLVYDIKIPKWKMLEDMDRFYIYSYTHPEEGRVTKFLYYIEDTGSIKDCIMWAGPGLEDSYSGAEAMDFFTETWNEKIEKKEIVRLSDVEKAKMLLLWNEKDGIT